MNLTYALREYLTPGGAYYTPENYHPWAPTQGYSYSNVAIALLGLVVQTVSGEDFYEYLSPNFLFDTATFSNQRALFVGAGTATRTCCGRSGWWIRSGGWKTCRLRGKHTPPPSADPATRWL